MTPRHVVVIGGSVAGLGAALALSQRGHRVTVLEADATPLPPSHGEAFERWQRKGSPQTRHSHALLARLRNLIRDHAPDLLERLRACGAEELRFTDRARQLFAEPELEPGDEDIVFLACRRITFEWALRRHVLEGGRVDFRDGVVVTRLDGTRDGPVPTVRGVWLRNGDGESLLPCDLVVDASGRRSKLPAWLAELGAGAIRQELSPCGIFYTSRFYRLREGVEPPELEGGIVGVDLGYLKLGVFSGDSRVFSITLAASPGDDALRAVLHRPGFEAAVSAIPLGAEWTAPELALPVSDVHGMAKLQNLRRWMVEADEPRALGVVAVGDSLIHTNPLVGRGCSLAWTAAFELADCLDAHGGDGRDLALAYHERIERQVVPWYEMQLAQDADSIEVAEAQQRGEDPFDDTNPDGTKNPKAFLRSLLKEGLVPALQEDLVLLRVFLRTLNLLDPPGDLMKNPLVMQRVIASYARRAERPAVTLGPTRAEMLDRLASASRSARAEPRVDRAS